MFWKILPVCVWAVLMVAACPGDSSARDTVRLETDPQAATHRLDLQGDVDTVPVHWRGHGYYHSYYRPYYHGYYRPYYSGYYRPYYYGGYYQPYYSNYYQPYYSSCYQPYYSSYYYPRYYGYYVPRVYYPRPYYVMPYVSYAPAPNSGYQPTDLNGAANGYSRVIVVPGNMTNGQSTYPYDGAPRYPVPLPKDDAISTKGQTVNKVVSIQAKPAKYSYTAYGEEPWRTENEGRSIPTGAKTVRK